MKNKRLSHFFLIAVCIYPIYTSFSLDIYLAFALCENIIFFIQKNFRIYIKTEKKNIKEKEKGEKEKSAQVDFHFSFFFP